MTITAGTRIGNLEFVAPLGAGGMGEVWRAIDTSLGRQVAVKLLPDRLASDPERLARFEREAKTLASLNHPNIAAVYGFETSTARHALVMELVEGDDLSTTIAVAAIPIDQALRFASQIADALEAAHEQGIVHRDLKPSNIKIRSDEMVKVLDFGLARAMESALSTNRTYSPTLTAPPLTEPGATLGTAAYMSPEQARGIPVDKRADLWSFGVVLWELLTRRRPFDGATVSDTLAAVLTREPDWALLPVQTPPSVRRLLRRCLEKDRKRRLDSAAAARLEIEEALTEPAERSKAHEARESAVGTWRSRPAAMLVAASMVAAGAVGAWTYWKAPVPPALEPETRVDIVTPPTDDPMSFALAPDGRQVVFSASDGAVPRLWLRSMASSKAEPLAGTDGARYPFWSPDGRSIAFFSAAQLRRLDLAGGAPISLAAVSSSPGGGTWNSTGVIVFAPSIGQPLFKVAAAGGAPVAITSLEGHTSHRFPSFLPDGRHFVFYATGPADMAGIYIATLDSSSRHRLTPADSAGAFMSSPAAGNWLLWTRAGALVGQRLDLDRLSLVGDLTALADQVAFNIRTRATALSASAGGLVAFRPHGASLRQLVWNDRSGNVLSTLGLPDDAELRSPDVSPQGMAAVYRVVQGNTDIWLMEGERTSRFTFDASDERYAIWSPDGGRLVFDSRRDGRHGLYVKAVSGAAPEVLLVDSEGLNATDWSADGKYVLYNSLDPTTDWDLWVLPMEAPGDAWPLLKTANNERQGTFSPDGRWVVYLSNASGRPEIYVRAFAAPAPSGAGRSATAGQWQVSTDGGSYPRWSHDGKEIYYISPTGAMMAATVTVTAAAVQTGKPVALFQARISGGGVDAQAGRQYDVAADGRFLINTVVDVVTPITLIQNWRPDRLQ